MPLPGPYAAIAWLPLASGDGIAGHAFLVRGDLAVTCAHVVRDHLGLGATTPDERPTSTIRLAFEHRPRMEVEAVVAEGGWWPDRGDDDGEGLDDIAVLRIGGSFLDDRPWGNVRHREPGGVEPCCILGCGRDPAYRDLGQGVKAELDTVPNLRRLLQVGHRAGSTRSYRIERGFSGAPVFDEARELVVGMVVEIDNTGHDIAFAIAGSDVCRAVTRVERLRHGEHEALRRQVAQAAAGIAAAVETGRPVRAAAAVRSLKLSVHAAAAFAVQRKPSSAWTTKGFHRNSPPQKLIGSNPPILHRRAIAPRTLRDYHKWGYRWASAWRRR